MKTKLQSAGALCKWDDWLDYEIQEMINEIEFVRDYENCGGCAP